MTYKYILLLHFLLIKYIKYILQNKKCFHEKIKKIVSKYNNWYLYINYNCK